MPLYKNYYRLEDAAERRAYIMDGICILQASEKDIPVVEGILLDAVNWLNEMESPLWGVDEVTWGELSEKYRIDEFYIAYSGGAPSGCFVLLDYDPFYWPDIGKGDSLFLHKLAVTKTARKTGVSVAMLDYSKKLAAARGVKALRLDTDALRPKTTAFYERNGFTRVCVRPIGPYQVAFYEYLLL